MIVELILLQQLLDKIEVTPANASNSTTTATPTSTQPKNSAIGRARKVTNGYLYRGRQGFGL
jgi:hypothetical protein